MPSGVCAITFAKAEENEPKMQQIGKKAEVGISLQTLRDGKASLDAAGTPCELIDLKAAAGLAGNLRCPEAQVLVVRGGVNAFLGDPEGLAKVKAELDTKVFDTQALMRGSVKNKHARHNCVFAEEAQVADIAKGRGTVFPFSANPIINAFCRTASMWAQTEQLLAVGELNHYHTPSECGIGFHGDGERRIVVGARFGEQSRDMPLRFVAFDDTRMPIGNEVSIPLNDGDVYLMSHHAVGTDWMRSGIHFRHATGSTKYAFTMEKLKKNAEAKLAKKREKAAVGKPTGAILKKAHA